MLNEYAVESSPRVLVDLNEKIRVLLVDDDDGLLKVAKGCLEMETPFQVDTANSAEEALTRLEKEKYDVIVSDYQMPGKDGLEFLDELRANGNSIPFIMFTGKGKEEIAIKALNLGADQYLNKTGDPATVYCELAHGIRQVAERKKAEEKIRQSEERYRNLFELAPDALVTLDMNGVITSCNAATLAMSSYSRDELIGQHFSKIGFLRMKDFIKYHALFASISKGKVTRSLQVTWHRKDGTSVFSELHIGPIKERDKTVGVQVIARDITERKKAEQKSVESQQKFAALFSGNPEATVHTDTDMHISDVNPRFAGLFGYSLDEIRGKHINDVVVPENLLEEGRMLDKKAAEGYVYHDTVRRKKNGSLIPVSVSAAPVYVQGELTGYVWLYKDISQQKNAETKLAMMNEKLRVIGGLTRHDVRNKLSIITGNTYLNKKRLMDHPEIVESFKEVDSACDSIVRIFDFARDYERLGVEELTHIDLEDSIQKAASLFPNIDGREIVSECRGLAVLADSLLRQLFYNLIDNSLKHGGHVTRIRIGHEESENELRLVYEDDGLGISEEAKPRLFTEGYTTGKGSGHGLYLIKKMTEVYGWTIRETGVLGKGARFVMTIPRMNEQGRQRYQVH